MRQIVAHLQSPLYRNAYALIVSVLGTSGLGIIYWVVAARLYSPEAVGRNSAILTTMMFLAGLGEFNLRIAMIRFIPIAGRSTQRLVFWSYLFSLSMGVVVGIIFLLGINLWSPALSFLLESRILAVWFVISILTWIIFALQDNVLTGLRQSVWVPVENVAFGVVKLLLLLVFVNHFGEYSIFASWTIPVTLSLLPVNYLLFKFLIPKEMAEKQDEALPFGVREIVRYVASDYAGAMLALSIAAILPIIVISVSGPSANAFFYQAWTIAIALRFISSSLSTSLTVEASGKYEDLQANSVRYLINTLRLMVPAVAVVFLFAPLILRIFGAQYAAEGTTLLRLLALSALPNTLQDLFRSHARVHHQMKALLVMHAVSWVITIGLSYLLIHQIGITGIGIAYLISDLFVAGAIVLGPLRPYLLRGRVIAKPG